MNVIYDRKQGEALTSNDQPFQVLSYDLLSYCACQAKVSVIGMSKYSGNVLSLEREFAVKRGISAAEIVGNIADVLPQQEDSAFSGASVSISPSGTALTVSVTGVQGEAISWLVYMDITVYQDNGSLETTTTHWFLNK